MTEKQFTKKLKEKLVEIRVDSLEGVGNSFPDLLMTPHYDRCGSFLCEAKVLRGTNPIHARGTLFERGQAKFLTEYCAVGDACFIIYCPTNHNVWVYDGKYARSVDNSFFCKEEGSKSRVRPLFKGNMKCEGFWNRLSARIEDFFEFN